jgi:transposase InsO family protein
MGGRKLHEMLQPYFMEHQIKMGRDALFDLLVSNHLLVRRRKRRVYTTQSFHWLRKYPNLIKGQQLSGPNQQWVSDITYWRIGSGYVYISLITDAFSHKIVGYHVADTLETVQTLEALKMAIQTLPVNHQSLTHHEYVQILQHHNIQISMTENSDPRENAIAERVNGILKEEYLYDYSVQTLSQAKLVLDFVINLYNVERPHMSCQYKTPETVHLNHVR